MKKFFLFAAAAFVSAAMTAQTVEVFNTVNSLVTMDTVAAEVTAGTALYNGTAFDVSVAFTDNYKKVNTFANGYKTATLGNAAIDFETGIQGATNPKTAGGGNPAFTLEAPTSGAVLEINAKAQGMILVVHKASSNKNYDVFENEIAIGYQFAMQWPVDSIGVNGVIAYTVANNNNELNQLSLTEFTVTTNTGVTYQATDSITKDKGIQWPERYFTTTEIKKNGVGVIAFPVYEDCKYWVNACGSKMSCSNVIFVAGNPEALDFILNETTDGDKTYPAVTLFNVAKGASINNVAADAKVEKFVKNGQIIIRKGGIEYTVLGTVAE